MLTEEKSFYLHKTWTSTNTIRSVIIEANIRFGANTFYYVFILSCPAVYFPGPQIPPQHRVGWAKVKCYRVRTVAPSKSLIINLRVFNFKTQTNLKYLNNFY